MYGKNLLNRLSKGCYAIKDSSWNLQSHTTPSSSIQLTSKQASFNLHVDAKLQRSSSNDRPQRLSLKSDAKKLKRTKSVCSEQDDDSAKKKNRTCELPVTALTCSDKLWMTFITSPQYMNWLKIGLALRSVCHFVSPVVDEIVLSMHASLLKKHGDPHSMSQLQFNKNDKEAFDPMQKWMNEVLKLHRSPPDLENVRKISEVEKWPTQEGAWEIARLFMSRRGTRMKDCMDSSSCDVSSLLNFLKWCRLVDGYVHDIQNVKRLLQVRNETMHNPRLEADNATLERSFDSVLNLLHDINLNKHAGRYMETSGLIRSVEELKTSKFDLTLSAKHSLDVLNDEVYNPSSTNLHPAAKEIASIRRALKRILIYNKSEDSKKIESSMVNNKNGAKEILVKQLKSFFPGPTTKLELFPTVEKIPVINQEPLEKMENKLTINDSVTKMNNKPTINAVFFSKMETKPTKNPLLFARMENKPILKPISLKKAESKLGINYNSLKTMKKRNGSNHVSFGKLGKKQSMKNASFLSVRKTGKMDRLSLVPSLHLPISAACSSISTDSETTITTYNSDERFLTSVESEMDGDQSVRLTSLVQGSLSFHSPLDYLNELNDPHTSSSEVSIMTPVPIDPYLTAAIAMNRALASSASLCYVPSVSGSQMLNQRGTKRKFEELQEPADFGYKMKKIGDSNKGGDSGEDSNPNKLIPLPAKGSGGPGGIPSFRTRLQNYLRKQPNNPGALFSIDRDGANKYICTVTFQSNYAIYAKALSDTQEDAKNRAALEANRWLLGNYRFGDGPAARKWFDTYAVQVVGRKPVYRCSRVTEDRFKTYIHLLNNRLFSDGVEESDSCRFFLEAACATRDPVLDVEDTVIKTALQEIKTPLENKNDNRKMLNEYCMENGGTIPVIHTSAVWHSKAESMSWRGTLKSFISRSLSQGIEKLDMLDYESKRSNYTDGYNMARIFADFLTAESAQTQSTPLLAEESAASDLMEKLGCPLKKVLEMQGSCKRHLEVYVYEMDYSVAYHTAQVTYKNKLPKYECVVASTCLYDTRTKFTVSSGQKGFTNEDSACESAAKNALHLLGIETDRIL